MRILLLAVLVRALTAQTAPGPAPDDNLPVFGTTVVVPGGLCGEIYDLRENTGDLPDFGKLEPLGAIYSSTLNVPSRDWIAGFPGITRRFEWFAIDYRGRFWIETPGAYKFSLLSDDGSALYIDEKRVINHDGIHDAQYPKTKTLTLSGGIHRIRVSYFQGPRFHVALVLQIAPPGGKLQIFDTNDFKPASNPEEWTFKASPDVLRTTASASDDENRRRLSLKGQLARQKTPISRCPADW